mmetsp:Transcript_28027/g.61760  ORF Transcript_28027/g.61760 Transcript_28027/m.61760 type:complete len:675 (+) Transcript_28027:192-2216(+)
MPHRPEGQGSSSSLSQGGVNSSVYTPPRVTGSTAAAIMRQQSSDNSMNQISGNTTSTALQYNGHPSGIVTPVVKSKAGLPWLAAGRNKSSDSTDRSMATSGTTDDSRSIATLGTEDEREATASALLMVAKAAEREQQQHYLKGMVVDNTSVVLASIPSAVSRGSPSTVPLKKRKKQLREDACHVSPFSHSSNDLESTNTSATGNHAHSYDSKDMGPSSLTTPKGEMTQELLDSSKVHSTAQIGAGAKLPISPVLIHHFPTVLHQVLVDKELAIDEKGPAIQWLPNGESFKVNDWNAMRRRVLPKYFSDLRDEHGSSSGTIDAFLYHIDAWGFEEIKTGANTGAYCHDLFIRGAQKLCVRMQFTSDLRSDGDSNSKLPNTVSPGRCGAGETERMMLQVPMLASAGTLDSKNQSVMQQGKRPRYDSDAVGQPGHGPLHWTFPSDPAAGVFWGGSGQYNPRNEVPHARAYGMRAPVALTTGNPYSTPNPSYSTPNTSFSMDPRMQLCRVPTSDSMNTPRQQHQQPYQYCPPQVRSGRGALRGIASTAQQNRGSAATSPSTTPTFRHGFPVSNRGRGRRKSASSRTTFGTSAEVNQEIKNSSPSFSEIPKTTNTKLQQPQTVTESLSLREAQRIGCSVQGVAVAISRKTKRKLPMAAAAARKPSESDASSALSAAERS